jgi:hypothetical protein
MTGKTLIISPEESSVGVVRGRMIPHNKGNIVYLEIDPEKANHDVLATEAKGFWLLYKKKEIHTDDEIPEPIIS